MGDPSTTQQIQQLPKWTIGEPLDEDWMGYNYLSSPGAQVFHSYSGCDIKAVIFNPTSGQWVKLANIQTLSYSLHREKFPVRALGTTHVRQYVRGPRTIAGSMIFTVFDQSVLGEFLTVSQPETETNALRPVTVDQIPPFHIILLFANEMGTMSSMVLYNVEIVNEGQTMSVEDLITENVCQFVATHMAPMRKVTSVTQNGISLYATNFKELMTKPLMSDIMTNRNPFDAPTGNALQTIQNLQKATGQKLG